MRILDKQKKTDDVYHHQNRAEYNWHRSVQVQLHFKLENRTFLLKTHRFSYSNVEYPIKCFIVKHFFAVFFGTDFAIFENENCKT